MVAATKPLINYQARFASTEAGRLLALNELSPMEGSTRKVLTKRSMAFTKVAVDGTYSVKRRDDDGAEELVPDEERCVVMATKSRDLPPLASKVDKLLFTSACLRLASRTTRKTLLLWAFELVV